MKYDKKIFQENVRTLRKQSNLSQEKFAEAVGISQHSVHVYEKENPNPTLDQLMHLAEFGNTTIEALLTQGTDDFNFGNRKPDAGDFEFSHFEGMTYHVYYLKSEADQLYHGFIAFDEKYDDEHLFLHGTASTGHIYDCKMVIEGTHTFYIYGIENDLPRRFHLAMYYPDFREEIKYRAGLGILTRIDSRKFFVGMRAAVTDKEIDIEDPILREKLIEFLSIGDDAGFVTVDRNIDNRFRNWVEGLMGM